MTETAANTDRLIRTLLDAGWTLTEGNQQPTHAFRPAQDSGLTVWMSTGSGIGHLQLDAERRRLEDGTVRAPWKAEVLGKLPVAVLAAVAEANARHCHPGAEPGALLGPAGWDRSPNWPRDWTAPDEERELSWIDDDMDEPNYWCIQRYDLQAEISASADTPADVIAAFALTDAPEPPPARGHTGPTPDIHNR